MSYDFNNHIKLFYHIKKERSTEMSYHFEVRLYSEILDVYKTYISDAKNSNIVQIQGILAKRDKKFDEIIAKDLLTVSIGLKFIKIIYPNYIKYI